jgi:hypothetical protein
MDAVQTLGKYEIRGTLGKGAMGTVYDGWDPAIARRVAIKTVSLPNDPDPDTAEEIARFRREAQAAGRLSHPNIVAVYDYGETADMAYIVMEFVDGTSLKAPLDNHERFALADIQRVMSDLLAGLQFSHDRGVVHRDIKPANIMMTLAGQAKIADFGIARIEMSSMTQAGTMLGTPSYMSPEQFRGEVVDARTDVYSAGVVLYQLLTGERPFEGGLTAIMHKVLNTEPPVPSELALTAPSSLDAVVKRAMAKRPDDRYPSAAAFAEAIRDALAAPSRPTPAPPPPDEAAEATLIGATLVRPPPRHAVPPPRPPVSATAAVPAGVVAPGAGAPRAGAAVAGAAVEPAPTRSRAPLLIGVGVAAVLGLGAGGWFLFGPAPHTSGRQAEGQRAEGQQVAGQPQSVGQPQATVPPQSVGQPQAAVPPQAPAQPQTPAAVGNVPIPAAPAPSAAQLPPAQSASPSAAPPAAVPSTPPPTAVVDPTPAAQAPKATKPPAAIQEASTDLHAARQQLALALAQAPCTLANGLLQDSGAVSISGYAGTGAAEALRQQLAGVVGAVPLDWQVQPVDQAFCGALGALRPIAVQAGAPVSGLSLTLAGGQTTLHDGERIMPRVTMADFTGEVRVDYLGHDGSVVHLYPTAADPAQHVGARPSVRLAPGAQLSIGEGGPGRPIWEVGPPYGTDMIIVVASSAALLTRAPAQNADNNATPYLRDLASGIARIRQSGGQVAGTLLLVDTVPK